MISLNTLRTKFGVVLSVVIGVALLAFILSLKTEMGFYQTPAIVAFLIALAVACFQNKKLDFNAKLKVMANGVADENILTMCLVFLAAGAFSGAISAAGGAESTVYLFLTFHQLQNTRLCVVLLERLGGAVIHFKTT